MLYCSFLSLNNSDSNYCAAADEEKGDPQSHVAVVVDLRIVGRLRFAGSFGGIAVILATHVALAVVIKHIYGIIGIKARH